MKNKALALAGVLMFLPSAAFADSDSLTQCLDNAHDEQAMEACTSGEYHQLNMQLGQQFGNAIKAIQKKVDENKQDEDAVRVMKQRISTLSRAQNSWRQYRDQQCASYNHFISGTINHGRYECFVRLTQERLKEVSATQDFTAF